MTQDRRDSVYGRTMSEWIDLVPGELTVDAVGLWQILAAGRHHFYLEGDELADYVRRNIVALIDAGAVPVFHDQDSEFEWTTNYDYGATSVEIANAVVNEWQASRDDKSYPLGIWFARPREGKKYVKL